MKLLTHPATTALGLTMLYLLGVTGQLTSSRHLMLYHWGGSVSGLFLPVLFNFLLIWILLTLLLVVAQAPGRLSATIWTALFVPLPWVLSRNWTILSGERFPLWFNALICCLAIAALLAVATGWKQSFAPAFERLRNLAATATGFAAILALLILCQLMWFGWQARNLNATSQLHRQAVSSPAGPRIVWILFDELSYRQVYEHRFPGLNLPAFDQFASQATVFTHTIPAGRMTEAVLPSLFTAEPIDRIRASSDGVHLFLHNRDSGAWLPFAARQTVFEDALNAGYSTAVAGWYNPYCRIMPQVLDQCFWTNNLSNIGGAAPSGTVTENLIEPIHHAITSTLSLVSRMRGVPVYNRQAAALHQLDYLRLYTAADHLLNDPSADFIFLHMPIPHPGGIYDRTTGNFATTHSTYIDNLALADKYLAHVRSVLEQNGTWDSSVIVIMGDHSWRTSFMWEPMPSWTHEEQVASDGGQFDDRPAYMVKLPHQQQPARIDFPYAAIHTRALLDALAHNQIRSTGDLSAWAGKWDDPGSAPIKPAAIASR